MDNKTKSKILTLLVFATPFVVGALATLWFTKPGLQPTGRTSVGTLVTPQVELPLMMHDLERRWQVITVVQGSCDQECIDRVSVMHKVWLALGKRAARGRDSILRIGSSSDVALLETFKDLDQDLELYRMSKQELATLIADNPQLAAPAHLEVWLVDPLGYVVLRYSREQTGNQVLRDWRRLLKISQIG